MALCEHISVGVGCSLEVEEVVWPSDCQCKEILAKLETQSHDANSWLVGMDLQKIELK